MTAKYWVFVTEDEIKLLKHHYLCDVIRWQEAREPVDSKKAFVNLEYWEQVSRFRDPYEGLFRP